MDKIIELLAGSGANIFEILLPIILLYGIVAIWRSREKTLESMRADGPMMAAIIKESSERIDRMADVMEQRGHNMDLLAAAMTGLSHDLKMLQAVIESEGRLNRQILEQLSRDTTRGAR